MLRNVFSTSRIVMALLALGLLIAVTALSPAAVGGLQTDGDPWPTTSPDASTDLQAAAELVRANQLTTDHSSPAVQEVDKQIGLETIEALSSNSPVMLIENVGQWDENARFQVWGARGTIWLAEDAIWLTLLGTSQETGEAGEELSVTPEPSSDGDLTEIDASHDVSGVNLKISFLTGDLAPTLEPISLTNTLINYFLGTEPGNWRIGVPTWSGVRYKNIIPDTDADIVISSEQFWQWHLMVPPDAAFGDISIRIDGANDLFVDDNGVLWLDTDVGRIPGPLLLTEDDSPLFVNQIDADVVTFDIQPPEPFNPLGTPSMSPDDNPGELVFSTFFGGSAYDSANAVAAGNVGETYVAGETYSYNFPTTPGAFDPSINGSSDIFIAKLPDFGQSVDFSTFIGGTNQDRANAISVHDDGTIYIVGDTSSYNYPTRSGTFDTSFNGGTDVVVTRLSSSGRSLIFSGYLGGSLGEVGGGIAVDASGAAYVTGQTWSTDFPTSSGAFDRSHNGNTDAFVSKIGPGGGSLVFSTFLGGSTYDFAYGIAVDSRGAPYVVGSTGSASFPTTPGAFNRTFAGFNDVFITRLNPSGSALEYSGLLGGNSDDQGQGIAVDSNGAAYISGQTTSTNFLTTPGAYDRNRSGFWDGFAAKISASGGNLVYSTYIGGNNNDCETSGIDRECVIALNDVGQAYIAGRTFSSDFPTTFDAFDRTYNGSEDGFMAKLNASGSALLYGSFFGGSGGDQTLAVAVDHTESAFVAGRTYSSNFPTNASAFDRTYNGSGDGFIIKLAVGAPPTPTPTRTPTSTPTPTNTSTRTITPTSTNTPANTDTPSPTSSPTLTPTPTRTTGPSVTNTPTPRLPTPTATPDFPICTVTLDKIAYPGTVGINDQVGVTLRLTGDCPGEIGAAVDVALVFDRSQSMCGAKLDEAQAAGQNFLDSMALPPDQASVISFAGTGTLHQGLTTNRNQATNALYNITCGGTSRLDAGLNKSFDEMTGPRRVAGHTPAVILLTDGNPTGVYADDVRAAARRIRDAGIQLYTVGLGADVNADLLREIATAPDHYYQSPTPADLMEIYTRLAGEVRIAPGFNVNLTDIVSLPFEVVPGSFTGAAIPQLTGRRDLRWYIPRIEQGVTEVGFSIRPLQCGTFNTNELAQVSYDDNRGNRHTRNFPVPTITVNGCTGDLTDVYVRDNVQDTGTIPSAEPWWDSPDIWVRHANDGGEEHQNPQAGQRNYIYARVLNRGTTTVNNITVNFYYGLSGLGLGWPSGWNPLSLTRTISSIPPGGSAVVSIPWDVPNISGHFCLRLHISAAPDPILDYRVGWDNNIAQRNLHVVEYPQPPETQCRFDQNSMVTDTMRFDVTNTLNSSSLVDLRITASGLPGDATMLLNMGALNGRWSSLDGLTVEPDQRLRVTQLPATVYGVRLNPQEQRQVQMEITAPANSRFTVSLAELVRGNLVGGNSYQRSLPACPLNLPLILKAPRCSGGTYTPPDVMLVIDRSGSMGGAKLSAAQSAAVVFLGQMNLAEEQAGLVSFNSGATLNQTLTHSLTQLTNAVNNLTAGGGTAIHTGINTAQAELQGPRQDPSHSKAMILLTDGQSDAGQALAAANAAKQAGTVIFTIGLGGDADAALLRQIATSPDHYYYAPTPDDLEEIYLAIAGQVGCTQ